ncbi:MAG: dihydrolipoyl dehydrogenase [Bdellovibrionales bacterium]|nr:dihydrolipoyl dehydrogenase [Bdellovibrionales bacterium]
MKKLDVAIIGAGTAGLSARSIVAKHTDNYKIFDAGILGTTCARVGCMPSKVLIQAAQDFYRRHKLSEEGIEGGDLLSVDLLKTFAHVRKLRDRFVKGVMEDMKSWQDTHLITEIVTFKNENVLETSWGETFEAKKIIIAAGSKPVMPEVFQGFEDFCVDTDVFFEMNEIPKKWAVIGTGVIGLELGQALLQLGLDVTLIARRKTMAGLTDPDILDYTIQKLLDHNTIIFENIQNVVKKGDQIEIVTDHQKVTVEKVLLAAGRLSNAFALGLSNIGISQQKNGLPKFDPETMLVAGTNHIFIAGDVNGDRPILHEAADEGRIAGFNACQERVEKFRRRTPLSITFTDPQIAMVGKTYQELMESQIPFVTGKVTFEGQGRSIVKLKEKGLLHLYANSDSGEILGAELFAPDGEHLAHMLSWAISSKWTVDQCLSKPFYHPVVQEGLRTALRSIKKGTNPIEIYRQSTVD